MSAAVLSHHHSANGHHTNEHSHNNAHGHHHHHHGKPRRPKVVQQDLGVSIGIEHIYEVIPKISTTYSSQIKPDFATRPSRSPSAKLRHAAVSSLRLVTSKQEISCCVVFTTRPQLGSAPFLQLKMALDLICPQ